MKSFVLSIEGSARLPRTLSSLAAFGIEPEVQMGVRGATMKPELVRQVLWHHPLRGLLIRQVTPSELGCTLSHYLTLNRILRLGLPRALIFEDDVYFSEDPGPKLARIAEWAAKNSNFLLNWGGQKDPRFGLPVGTEVYRSSEPDMAIIQVPQMLWNTHCLVVDRQYCIERLSRAFPVVYVFDVYGMLRLNSSFFVVKEPRLSCDPDLSPEAPASMIEGRLPSLLSRVFPRHTRARLTLERLRDRLVSLQVGQRFWSLGRTRKFLDELESSLSGKGLHGSA